MDSKKVIADTVEAEGMLNDILKQIDEPSILEHIEKAIAELYRFKNNVRLWEHGDLKS